MTQARIRFDMHVYSKHSKQGLAGSKRAVNSREGPGKSGDGPGDEHLNRVRLDGVEMMT